MTTTPNMLNEIAKELVHLPKPAIERGISLEGVANARQLGGLVMQDGRIIKDNLLLRTAHLADASKEDLKKLQEIYGLSLVIDLRSSQENMVAPDKSMENVPNINHSFLESQLSEDAVGKMGLAFQKVLAGKEMKSLSKEELFIYSCKIPQLQQMLDSLYVVMVSNPESQKEIAAALHDILKQEGKTVLWHCTQGKDRCGLMSVMMLGALGADRETILHDFAISNDAYAPLITRFEKVAKAMQVDERTLSTLQGMLGVFPSSMEKALDWIDAHYGNIPHYLTEALGITSEEIEKLREYYLTTV